MFRRGPGRLEMCFYAYKNVLEPMGHLGANLIFSILTLNQVVCAACPWPWPVRPESRQRHPCAVWEPSESRPVCICLSRYVRGTVSLRRGVGCPLGGKFTLTY